MDECPKQLQPIDGKCPAIYPKAFTTVGGQLCCYKDGDFFTKMKVRPMNSIANFNFKECPELRSYEATFADLFSNANITDRQPDQDDNTYDFELRDFTSELYGRNLPDDYCRIVLDQLPTISWLTKQRDYTNSFTDADTEIVRLYTWDWDGPLNTFMRTGKVEMLYQDKRLHYLFPSAKSDIERMTMFMNKLSKLIAKAPVLDKDILVFRGVNNDIYNVFKKNNIFDNKGFVSTTLSTNYALENCGKTGFSRIRLVKGTKCLLAIGASTAPCELEIILPHGTVFYVQHKQFVTYTDHVANSVETTQMVVIK
jgi:hypothetical protein